MCSAFFCSVLQRLTSGERPPLANFAWEPSLAGGGVGVGGEGQQWEKFLALGVLTLESGLDLSQLDRFTYCPSIVPNASFCLLLIIR